MTNHQPSITNKREMWLAPLRGVTIRAFREAFAVAIREAGFTGAVAPFIPANPGIRVTDRILADLSPFPKESVTNDQSPIAVIPQIITKDPAAMRELLKGLKDRGFERADLNAGCPFPMIRRRGRGSGLLKTPDVLARLLEAGCDEMGPGRFSLKTRLGVEHPDELRGLMPVINDYPLAVLTVHARTAKQMYDGVCNHARFAEIASVSVNPIMYNGDVQMPGGGFADDVPSAAPVMIGRSFIRAIGARDDAAELLRRYIEISCAELSGDRPVLGRMKELLSYWTGIPCWRHLWPAVKICRTIDELLCVIVRIWK